MANGAPHAGITVQIDGAEYRKPVTVTAGEDGRFVFSDVKAGTRVRVMALLQGRAIASSWTLVTSWVETVDLTEIDTDGIAQQSRLLARIGRSPGRDRRLCAIA